MFDLPAVCHCCCFDAKYLKGKNHQYFAGFNANRVAHIHFVVVLIKHTLLWNLSKKKYISTCYNGKNIASILFFSSVFCELVDLYGLRVCVVHFLALMTEYIIIYINVFSFWMRCTCEIRFYLPIRSKHFCFVLLLVGCSLARSLACLDLLCYYRQLRYSPFLLFLFSFFSLFFLHLMIPVWCYSEIIEIVWMFLSAK